MHATKKLDQELTVTMPVKFLSAIARALVEAAEQHQAHLSLRDDMTDDERTVRESCIVCYGEVYKTVAELVKGVLTQDDVATLQQIAIATAKTMAADKGVVN